MSTNQHTILDDQPLPIEGQARTKETDESDQEPAPFPVGLLPKVMRDIVQEVADVFNMPAEIPAGMALATVAAAPGSKIQLSNPPYKTAPNLYLVTEADSGTGKSAAAKEIIGPFRELEKEALLKGENARRNAEAEKQILEAKIKKIKNSKDVTAEDLADLLRSLEEAEQKARPPIWTVEDATSEALTKLTQDAGGDIFSVSSDARACVQNILGQYKSGMTDDDFLVKAFSGDSCQVHRITRESVQIEKPCLTLFWAIQPDLGRKLWENESLQTSGFLARCLFTKGPRRWSLPKDRDVAEEIKREWARILENIVRYRDKKEPWCLTLSDEAKALHAAYHQESLGSANKSPDVGSFYARHGEIASRLAIVLHMVEAQGGFTLTEIGEDTMGAAIGLMRWFAEQQMMALEGSRRQAMETQFTDLMEIARSKDKDHVTPYMVSKTKWAADRNEAEALLKSLSKHGFGSWEQRKIPGKPGRPTRGLYFNKSN